MKQDWIVERDEAGQRLDVFCVGKVPQLSRAQLQRAIKEGMVTVNGQAVKPRQEVRAGDVVALQLEVADVPIAVSQVPKLPILYEDDDVVVVDKPAGVVVHPAPIASNVSGASPTPIASNVSGASPTPIASNVSGAGPTPVPGDRSGVRAGGGTVADWFAQRYPEALDVGEGEDRAGIVHRLDKETSGVLILAKTAKAYEHLKKQFAHRYAKKGYVALVFGVPGGMDGRIVQPLARSKRNPLRRTVDPAGKRAITEWRLKEKFGSAAGQHSRKDDYALLHVFPLTGRTHQIRVHLHWLGYPIVGDKLYVFKRQRPPQGVERHLLHAETLTLRLPSGVQKTFTAPLPDDFSGVLEALRV